MLQNAESAAKLTEPPLHYSEADILTQMEKYSLGTPATRAEIIERLLETEALERQNGRLFPTKKGKQLLDLVNEDLKSPELTAKWEQELENIARGKADPKVFLQNISASRLKLWFQKLKRATNRTVPTISPARNVRNAIPS